MPTPLIKATARKSHRKVSRIEGYWDQAKKDASKKFDKETDSFWAYVNAIVQRRSGLRECTFAEFVRESDDDDPETGAHHKALKNTGFYGRAGAGCVIVAKDTGRILMPYRSKKVEQPHTWGTWGGAIDADEDPKVAARREVVEESGYDGQLSLQPLFTFSHPSGFKYYNFLALVESEFEPTLDWETESARWCSLSKLPRPLHFGLKSVLEDGSAMAKLKAVCKS